MRTEPPMRALVLSDIHSNLEALNAVLGAAAGGWDVLWNLGDMVGYGASPNQVLDIIRPLSTLTVRSSHDRVCSGADFVAYVQPNRTHRSALDARRAYLGKPGVAALAAAGAAAA